MFAGGSLGFAIALISNRRHFYFALLAALEALVLIEVAVGAVGAVAAH